MSVAATPTWTLVARAALEFARAIVSVFVPEGRVKKSWRGETELIPPVPSRTPADSIA